LAATATDDGLPAGSTLQVSWTKASGPDTVTFSNPSAAATTAAFGAEGTYVLRLTASDSALTAGDDVTVTVNPAIAPPTVSITSPADGSPVTTRANVVGSVSEGSIWRVEYSRGGEASAPAWVTLASGTTPVSNGVLAAFDPTALLNGIYTIRLVATDAAMQTSTASVSAVVEGEQKVGNFSLSFLDLDVPVAGLPIQVIRNYDSRDKAAGDFGVGWRLGLKSVRLDKSGNLGLHWEETRSGGLLPIYCAVPTRAQVVSVTFPGGKVYKFQAALNPQCQRVIPLQYSSMVFTPLPGTVGSLAAVGSSDVFLEGSYPGPVNLLDLNTLEPYNPTTFELTTADGTAYLVDELEGVRRVSDTNGNTLTVGRDGITHSSGKSISFTRDAAGRITRITDPAGNAMTYSYDAGGDLVDFADRESNHTTFAYNGSHGMLSMKDARGVQPIRNDYDEQGRLVSHTDADGKKVTYTHDPDGRRETNVDRLGNTTVYDYDLSGRVTRITKSDGSVISNSYDARGNKLSETNALGKVILYTYDAQNNKTSETDALGFTTAYTYNGLGQVLTVTDPLNRVTANAYDAKGNLTSNTDALGNTTGYTYNAAGQRTSVTDAQGNVSRYEYDAAGNVTKETDALGRQTVFTYDVNGNRLTKTVTRAAPGGAAETLVTAYAYDKLNRLVKTTYPDGTTSETAFDSTGHESASVDQQGRRTTYDYDLMGRLVRATYPDGTKEESTYDAEGHRLKFTDRAGHATSYEYDLLGRLVKTTYPDGATAKTKFDALDRVVETTDGRGNVTRFEYDPNCGCSGRRSKVTDALGNVTAYAYDGDGNRVSMTDAKGQTTRFEYDGANRRTRVLLADGGVRSVAYDKLGRVTSRTDEAGKTLQYEYDPLGRLSKVTDALGGTTTYTHDERGSLLSETDANNHTTSYEYDGLGRRTKRTLPLGMSETYSYDAAGRLLTRTDFNGKTTAYGYDTMGRMTRRTPDASLGQSPVVYTYTATGQRASMADASGTTTYTYDARDRLTGKATPRGTLSYTYDDAGNVLTARSSNADGLSVNYGFDALNRLSTVTDNRLSAATSYAYDANGNLEGMTYPNGVHTSYTYDRQNRLTNLSIGGAVLADYAYTLGAAGNRLSVTEKGGRTVNYTYDALYRLTGETISGDAAGNNGAVAYTYDAVGNRLTRASDVAPVAPAAATYDANDRLNGAAYDANGNTKNLGGAAYGYDFENRITSTGDGASFVYDGDGNRVAKTVGGLTTYYLVDTNNPTGHAQVAEELVGGAVARQYTYGHDLISQNQIVGGARATSFYGYDGQGSVRLLTDSAGNVTDTYTYDAFGVLLSRTGTTPNDYLYAGEQFDANLGFYYLRARYMDPATGRFLSTDSFEGRIFEPQTLHKYLYAHADPLNNNDPSGHMAMAMTGISSMGPLMGMAVLAAATILSLILLQLYQAGVVSTIQIPALESQITRTQTGQQTISRAREETKDKTETARRDAGCRSNILYHYTSRISAISIFASRTMYLTREWTDPSNVVLPKGAYATDIAPWTPMTQRQLAEVFYFNPWKQERADLSWFVALCNDTVPPFMPAGVSGQWTKPTGDVNPIIAAPNPMP
jgi:RHS repeat-associated protein